MLGVEVVTFFGQQVTSQLTCAENSIVNVWTQALAVVPDILQEEEHNLQWT